MKGHFEKYREKIFQLFESSLMNNDKEFRDDINQLKAFYYRYWQRYPSQASEELALKYLNQAREAKQAMAMTDWAIINLDKQYKSAMQVLESAAKAKEPKAMAILGNLLLNGKASDV